VRFDSPWGEGYPGWHIECSAMSLEYLGERFDLHTGGVDLTFPHHDDEIAQSEGAVGHRVVTHWVHGDHLLFSGQKMAKSAGNVWTLDRIEEGGYHPLDFRYLCLTSRYRRQLRFSPDALDAASTARARLRQHLAGWGEPNASAFSGTPRAPGISGTPRTRGLGSGIADSDVKAWGERFREAVLDDLDFPRALTVVWALVADAGTPPAEKAGLLREWDDVLGLGLAPDEEEAKEEKGEALPAGAAVLIEARDRARKAKRFEESDRLRDELAALGVEVADTREGTTWRLS
jgi:cysteinyl-tRNA synthetase